ncbi:hypothetical protein GGH92_010796, partial [Coemansia sp. RSA 2673]
MWRLNLRQIGGQPESLPPASRCGHLTSNQRTMSCCSEPHVLRRTKSLPSGIDQSNSPIFTEYTCELSGYSTVSSSSQRHLPSIRAQSNTSTKRASVLKACWIPGKRLAQTHLGGA